MQLNAPNDQGAVDIFTRLVTLRIPVDSTSGVPGQCLLSNHAPAEDLLVMLHEFEHVTALSRPLGWLLTGLGLRTIDSHNAYAKLVHELLGTNDDRVSRRLASDLIRRLWDFETVAIDSIVVVNLLLPLLEGLAIYAEGSLPVDSHVAGPPSYDLAIAVAYQHARAVIRDNRAKDRYIDDPLEGFAALWTRLLERLSLARSERAGYESTMELFFGPSRGARGQATAPYFLGYLYVVRLLANWRRATGGQASGTELFLAANRLVGEIVSDGCCCFPLPVISRRRSRRVLSNSR